MAGINKVRVGHDDVYEATEVIEGGLLVVPASGATNSGVQGIAVAGDAATDVLGVSARRAEPVADQNLTGTDGDGYTVTYPNTVNELTTVYKGAVVPVTYADTSGNTSPGVAFGVKLAAAANGEVRPYYNADPDGAGAEAADADPRAIIGECRVVGGMGAAGGVGLAYIY